MEIHGLYVLEVMPQVYHIGDPTGVFATLVVGSTGSFLADTTSGAFDLAGVVGTLSPHPVIVANTHGHADVVGGNGQFERVYLAPADLKYAELGCSEKIKQQTMREYPELWEHSVCRDSFLRCGTDNLVPLTEDLRFDLGDETIVPVPIPNHTPGSMGFLCVRRRLLIAGDAVSPWMVLYHPESCSLSEHIQVLRRLQQDDRFDHFLSVRSGRLWAKRAVDTCLSCAENAAGGRTTKYVDPFFPECAVKKYIYHTEQSGGDCAVILFNPDKI